MITVTYIVLGIAGAIAILYGIFGPEIHAFLMKENAIPESIKKVEAKAYAVEQKVVAAEKKIVEEVKTEVKKVKAKSKKKMTAPK